MSKEPWIFNGAKFRLHSFHWASHTSPLSTSSYPSLCSDSAEDQDSRTRHKQTGEETFCVTNGLHDAALNGLDLSSENLKDSTQRQASSTSTDELSTRDKHTEDNEPRPLLTLRVGLTCYKDYLGTNWSCQVTELRRRGEVEFNNSVALLAQPLGVGAIMCTNDGQVVLIKRSQRVAEACGQLDIPGGHPEPKVRRNEVNHVALIYQVFHS